LWDARTTLCAPWVFYINKGPQRGGVSLITAEPHQDKGYGHHMMRFLMKTAKDRGVQEVILSASSEAGFRLYERLDFEKVDLFDCFEYQPSSGQSLDRLKTVSVV
jgi:ribosomal protein S18 acetylase RimI-like enzyme